MGIALEHPVEAVPVATPSETAGEVRQRLTGRTFASVEDVVVLVDGSVAGLLALETLIAAPEDASIAELMDSRPAILTPGTEPSVAAHRLVARGEASLVVVDDSGGFKGLVPPSRMISVLLAEHDEDLARLGGYVAGADRARGAASEPVSVRLLHRLPWLLIGLAGAMFSAVLVGAFEGRLRENVLVVLFIPAVVYMADAVGTQTETVLIRALAAEVSIRSMVRRELMTGALVGSLIGLAFFGFALVGWGDERLALAVGVALFASCSIATALAMLLPAIFVRLGQDPAFGSGPLATVAQDLLSIVVYFAAVVAIGV
jgi:magnesium transporter